MRRLANRVEKVEQAAMPQPVLLHVGPNQTVAKARAAHERRHGKIPEDAKVVVIHHTFVSAL